MNAIDLAEHEASLSTPLTIVGKHAELATPEDIADGLRAAYEVFERNQVDPAACLEALSKLKNDELLSREEAFMCVVWDEAEEAAFRKITLGWLSRDVDIQIALAS